MSRDFLQCVKAFPTIDSVIRGFLPRGDITGATFLPDNASGESINQITYTRSASVTFATLPEASNAVSWMHGRFYGGKQIRVRFEGEPFARRLKRPCAPAHLGIQDQARYIGPNGTPHPGQGLLTPLSQWSTPPVTPLDPPTPGSSAQSSQFPNAMEHAPSDSLGQPSAVRPPVQYDFLPPRRDSAQSDKPNDTSVPMSLTPLSALSWSGSEFKPRSMPPDRNPSKDSSPFASSLVTNEDIQLNEENDVLGILAGLSCDDDDVDDVVWQRQQSQAENFGPIGQGRSATGAEANLFH